MKRLFDRVGHTDGDGNGQLARLDRYCCASAATATAAAFPSAIGIGAAIVEVDVLNFAEGNASGIG